MTPTTLAACHAAAFDDTRAWSATEFSSLLSQPGTAVSGDARAFALIRVTMDEAELLTIATDPAHRRQGLARATLAKAENDATALGARHIFLEVAENNVGACALYAAAGYAQVGQRPKYYKTKDGAYVTALILRKQLLPG